jgi:2-(1,2-epoxy-1,2-dihydrophenyl)acetyl-CoA isomerase
MAVIEQHVRDDIAVIRLNRPEAKNSLTLEQIRALHDAVQSVAASPVRCLLLTGAADSFCAGRDLKETDVDREDTHTIMTSVINPLLRTLYELPVPTVAAVHGPALGLGFGLALCCDVTLVAENAIFGSPFRNFGGVMDSGGHYFLESRIGRHRTAELIFTGRLIDGLEAARLGLVNRAIAATELERESWAFCRDIATGPTAAFRATKQILAKARTFEEVIELEAHYMDAVLKGPDGREGLAAFKEKRRPRFLGL